MIRAAILCAALALGACGPYSPSDAPARYERAGEVRLIVGSAAATRRACLDLGLSAQSRACYAVTADGACTIWLTDPREAGAADTGRSLDHELAHCGGWPPDHPA